MFKRKPTPQHIALQKTIDDLIAEMATLNGDSAEYAKMTKQLIKLYKLQDDLRPASPVNPDTLVLAGANLAGIAMIVWHEKAHVVTSKALMFLKSAIR